MGIRLTTIIPIYNAFEEVKSLLEDIVKNYNFNLAKCILINDCSRSEVAEFIQSFISQNAGFTLINNDKNIGKIQSCNKALKKAHTELITILDSDTRIPSKFCEKIIECFDKNPSVGIACPINSNSNYYYIPLRDGYDVEKMNELIRAKHLPKYPKLPEIEGCCYSFRKEVIDKIGLLDENYGKNYKEELDFSYRGIEAGFQIALIDDLYIYHKRKASITNQEMAEELEKNNILFLSKWRNFRDNYKKEKNLLNPCIEIEKEVFENKVVLKQEYTIEEYKEYIDFLEKGYQTNFVEYKEYPKLEENRIKPIAFYLPQYYSFPENDKWHGKGFTEWSNTVKAIPQFSGHFQPHLPYDLGFYNLNSTEIMQRQIELAKNYGIFGFSFYYYWFSGKKLMEKPVYNYLNDKSLDFPFCLCWACENWSKLWDGGNRELLIKSELKEADFELFWKDLLPFLQDKRYIRINNKPVLILYSPSVFDKKIYDKFVIYIREQAKKCFENGIYLILALTNDLINKYENFDEFNVDSLVEFPPHGLVYNAEYKVISGYKNSNFAGDIYNMEKFITKKEDVSPLYGKNPYRTVFPMWDNSPRKAKTHCSIMYGMTPELYKKWLESVVKWTKKHRQKEEQFVFINAWNEWGEGAHLEPDTKHGYAFLEATREVIQRNYE